MDPGFRRNGGAMSWRLEGKIAIVTGAASGIGKASAALFARRGRDGDRGRRRRLARA